LPLDPAKTKQARRKVRINIILEVVDVNIVFIFAPYVSVMEVEVKAGAGLDRQ
jgi:hypothetical protein